MQLSIIVFLGTIEKVNFYLVSVEWRPSKKNISQDSDDFSEYAREVLLISAKTNWAKIIENMIFTKNRNWSESLATLDH